ncbi:hypothetical protein PYCC9005_005399 [Savitreella phatthalungensis]
MTSSIRLRAIGVIRGSSPRAIHSTRSAGAPPTTNNAVTSAGRSAAEPVPVAPPTPPAPLVQPVVQSPTVHNIRVKRTIGGLRGGITGFLLGLAVAGGLGYTYLLQEYSSASALLLASVEELEGSTSKVAKYVRRIEELERAVDKQRKSQSTQQDHSALRSELHKVYAQLNADNLDLRAKLVELEGQLARASKA